ncbi:TetR/AcrR family transcriptional regulator [Mycobacterium sp. NPDC003323]
MRRHGWSGATPADDEEAVGRILDAAKQRIGRFGGHFGISDVAKDIGVTRQTVYRYFPSTEALLFEASLSEIQPFLDSLAYKVRGVHDPAEAVVGCIAYVLERLPTEKNVSLLLNPGKASVFSAGAASASSMSLGRLLLAQLDVDWDCRGLAQEKHDGLIEIVMRILRSLVIDPVRPSYQAGEIGTLLHMWVAPAVSALTPAFANVNSLGQGH